MLKARVRFDFDERDPIGFTGEMLREWWALDEAQLETDAWIALRGEEIVGYARARRERDLANIEDESCVHPEARGRGIGSRLLDLAESWARERRLERLHVHVVSEDGRRLVETRGHELVRYFWRMEIDLPEPPDEPEPPAGFDIRAYRPGADDEALHAMHQEAFAGHWEFTPQPLGPWLKWHSERSDYQPELWRLAVDENGKVVGSALCFGELTHGWVLDLAVGSAWRKQGLGLALLQSGFRALAQRGYTHAGLEVDSENETGATRLYERAGMRVTRRYATYEKRLGA